MLIELLQHSDHNCNYFAASKLKSIITTLRIVHQTEAIEDLIRRLVRLKTNEFVERSD